MSAIISQNYENIIRLTRTTPWPKPKKAAATSPPAGVTHAPPISAVLKVCTAVSLQARLLLLWVRRTRYVCHGDRLAFSEPVRTDVENASDYHYLTFSCGPSRTPVTRQAGHTTDASSKPARHIRNRINWLWGYYGVLLRRQGWNFNS